MPRPAGHIQKQVGYLWSGNMKVCTVTVILGMASFGLIAGSYSFTNQSSSAPSQMPSAAPSINNPPPFRPGAGTVLVIELLKSIDAKKAKPNDVVEGSVFQDLLYQGRVIIPHDAKVYGHIIEAFPSTKEQPQSRLSMVFDKIVLKDKKELPMQYPAAVLALAPPISMRSTTTTKTQDMPVQMEKGRTTGGAAIDAIGANAQLAGANMRAAGEGALSGADRGVIRMKNLAIETNSDGTTVIVSGKGDIKLISAVQMVLRVIDPPKK